MQKKTSASSRSRAEILAEIAALPPSVQGRISSYKNVRKNGTTVTYHNLQWWADEDSRAKIVCVMGDGTGMPMRKECLQGAKGKNGRAKTREVKAGAIFAASKTKENEPR